MSIEKEVGIVGKEITKRISNGEEIDLAKLTVEELYRLHFEEEKYAASILKTMKPFSKERYDYLNKSYDLIEKIKKYRNRLEKKTDNNKNYLYRVFRQVKGKVKNDKKVVLELGCGNGKFLQLISTYEDLEIYGCDLHPNTNIKNVTIYKDTIINTLNKFDDNSIDILVADNVCEHFFKDEVDFTYTLIHQKLKKGGQLIFAIPNRNIGPSDISKKFLPMGSIPVGFHFMEQTYKENIKMFKKYGFYTNYISLPFFKGPFLLYNLMNIPNFIKIRFEKIVFKIYMKGKVKKKWWIKKGKSIIDSYNFYILKKKKMH